MFNKCKRYIKLRSCESKACVDVNIDSNVITEDMKTLKYICNCLEPLKVSTEALCQNDVTLLSLEATIQFLLNKLSEIATPYSQNSQKCCFLKNFGKKKW